jgi:hypothetical protein
MYYQEVSGLGWTLPKWLLPPRSVREAISKEVQKVAGKVGGQIIAGRPTPVPAIPALAAPDATPAADPFAAIPGGLMTVVLGGIALFMFMGRKGR